MFGTPFRVVDAIVEIQGPLNVGRLVVQCEPCGALTTLGPYPAQARSVRGPYLATIECSRCHRRADTRGLLGGEDGWEWKASQVTFAPLVIAPVLPAPAPPVPPASPPPPEPAPPTPPSTLPPVKPYVHVEQEPVPRLDLEDRPSSSTEEPEEDPALRRFRLLEIE